MNGFDNITARVEADALRRSAELTAQTEEQLRTIHLQTRQRIEQERIRSEALTESIVKERLERLRSAAQMEEKVLTLYAKQEVIGEAFALALKKLSALPQERYLEVLCRFVAQSVLTGQEELILNAADRAALGQRVTDAVNAAHGTQLRLSEQVGKMCAGFILRDGDREVNGDFAMLLRLKRPQLEREATARLFPKESE